MNCIIPGLNVKVLARAIQALAKVGTELFIEARPEKLTFLTFNQHKTVCGQYHLLDSFFSQYDIKESEVNEQNSAVSCKIHMKTLLPIFKGTYLEKKLDFIKIGYENNSDVIQFKTKYKCDDIIMIHTLRLMDPEILTIENNANSGPNNLCAASTFYTQLLSLFSCSDDDITLEITKNNVIARNYYVGAPHVPKSVRSQVNLNASEFSIFRIQSETTINFSLKPLRTAIQFAESFNLNIGINFEKGGRPLSLIIKNPTFEVIFIVATLNPYNDGLSSIATTSLSTKITQVNSNGPHNITSDDLAAIANENWDEFDIETDNLRKSPDRDKTVKENVLERVEKAKKRKNLSETNVSNWLENKKITTKGKKQFVLDCDRSKNETIDKHKNLDVIADKNNARKNKIINHGSKYSDSGNAENDIADMDLIPRSPESPRTKKARLVFKRSYDPTFHEAMCGDVLLPDSDSD